MLMMTALQGRKIMLVDDNDSERQLLADFLQQQGCRLYLARNGQDALVKLPLARPELVLMDVRMPVLDGLSACRAIRNDAALCVIPVIFLSGAVQAEERRQGLLAGGVDYIAKPYRFEEVRLRLVLHLPDVLPAALVAATDPDDRLFEAARRHWLTQPAAEPAELAQRLGIGRERLDQAFRRCVGIGVAEYLHQHDLAAAHRHERRAGLALRDAPTGDICVI
jgi:CheY-like chemotaxis protein